MNIIRGKGSGTGTEPREQGEDLRATDSAKKQSPRKRPPLRPERRHRPILGTEDINMISRTI